MLVMILPIEGSTDTAAVHVDGTNVGTIGQVSPETPWADFTGAKRIGTRWMPTDLDPTIPGPATPAEAALLLLAMQGYDQTAAVKALRLAGTGKRRAA